MALQATLMTQIDANTVKYLPLIATRQKDQIKIDQRGEIYFIDYHSQNALVNGQTIYYKIDDPLPVLFSPKKFIGFPLFFDNPKSEYPKQFITVKQIPDKLTMVQKLLKVWEILKS